MTEHLDADALADLDEGLLDRDHMASAASPRGRLPAVPGRPGRADRRTGTPGRGRGGGADARGRRRPPGPGPGRRRHRARQDRGHPQRRPAAGAAALRAPRACAGCRPPPWSCWSLGRRCRGRLGPARLRRQQRHGLQSRPARPARPTSEPRPTAATRSPPAAGTGPRSSVDGRVPQLLAGTLGPSPAAEQRLRPGRREPGRPSAPPASLAGVPGGPAGRRAGAAPTA